MLTSKIILPEIIPSATHSPQITQPATELDITPTVPNSSSNESLTVIKNIIGIAIANGIRPLEKFNNPNTNPTITKSRWEVLSPNLQPFKNILLRYDIPQDQLEAISRKYSNSNSNSYWVSGKSPEILYDTEHKYKSAPHINKGFTKYAKVLNRIIQRGDSSFKTKFKDAEILIIGPGKGAGEILEFIKLFPDVASIHIVDIRKDNFIQIDKDLEEYKRTNGPIKPPIYGYISNTLELPKELEESMDLVYHTNVFDGNYFTPSQRQQAASEITKVIKKGGVHVTTYLTVLSSFLHEFGAFAHDNHEEGFTKYFDKDKLVLEKGGAFQIRLKK